MKGYRISIIRHGMTEANEKGIYIGSTDMPLSAKGASELASKMDEFDYPSVHKVYTSPLCRCRETAEELINRDDYKTWLRGGSSTKPPNGESLEEMTARTFSALHNIIIDMMNNGLTHCAIITHSGIISNLLSCFGLPKYDAKYLNAKAGEGFDIIVTTQMWLNSQAFEILGYCPYEKIPEDDYEDWRPE